MSLTKSAKPEAEHVKAFCGEISATAPNLIPVTPLSGCAPGECFFNVRNLVNERGGSIRLGWAIWELEGIYIEAEHHAVYDPGDGTPWLDPTPSTDGDTHRLFLPDDEASYDFNHPERRKDNIRKAISKSPDVREYLRLIKRLSELIASCPGFRERSIPDEIAQELFETQRKCKQLYKGILQANFPRNGPCPCGSGKKFKRCHGA